MKKMMFLNGIRVNVKIKGYRMSQVLEGNNRAWRDKTEMETSTGPRFEGDGHKLSDIAGRLRAGEAYSTDKLYPFAIVKNGSAVTLVNTYTGVVGGNPDFTLTQLECPVWKRVANFKWEE